MTNYPATDAILVAPLSTATAANSSCKLERVAVLVGNGHGQEKYLEMWVQPDSLAAVIKAKRALCPGNWFILETFAGDQLPEFGLVA
ncbi:hypothetical protein N836_31645 [Leptolyngbya sp. Heron Island J]|uniref:hypothetical protein n=1 Tax=Leptolyngbya sp. Heron Island J TaxID=1385935 RepID=UPI0003B9704D|nr:hypothetical protein [Leptolyngbya sp. Heron Island J]ESA38496.1 hypothetical protein N836_31645 [Leptolyngbya sp. Heron Island J]